MSLIALVAGLWMLVLGLSRLLLPARRRGQYRNFEQQVGAWNRLFGCGPPSAVQTRATVTLIGVGTVLAGLVLTLLGLSDLL